MRFYETGGPEVLKFEDVAVGDPGPGEVRIRHAAVGCNFADTYFRLGYYPVPLPNGMGVEAAGTIEAVGEGVLPMPWGTGSTYTGSPLGAYSDRAGDACRAAVQAARCDFVRDGGGFDHARAVCGLLAARDQPAG